MRAGAACAQRGCARNRIARRATACLLAQAASGAPRSENAFAPASRLSQFVPQLHELAPVEAESAPAEQDDVKVEAGAMLVSLSHKHTHAHTCLCVCAPVLGAATSRSCICLTLAIHAHITRSRLGARLQGARRGCCCARGLRVLRRPRPDIVHICAHAQTHMHTRTHALHMHTYAIPPAESLRRPTAARAGCASTASCCCGQPRGLLACRAPDAATPGQAGADEGCLAPASREKSVAESACESRA